MFGSVVLLLSLNLALTSCWITFGGDGNSARQGEPASTPSARASSTATRTPTRTATPIPTRTPTPTVTPSPTQGITTRQLDGVLLTTDDLPPDWNASDAVDLGADREVSICDAPGPDTVIEPIARSEVQFQQSDFGPFLAETLSAYRSDADARRIMRHLRSAISCQEWDDEANDTAWDISPLSFPEKGDETFSIEMQTNLGLLGAVRFHAVFIRTGSVVTLLAHGTLGRVDMDETEVFVDLALDLVSDLPSRSSS